MNEPLGPDELASILRREYDAADHYYEQIEPLMEAAFRYYEAQPFGNEVDGRSQIVLPDVQEAIDGALAVILKTFLTSGDVVEFEATAEEDEQGADDATASLNFKFMREQDGYRVVHDFVLDALQKKIGVLKVACYEEEKVSRQWLEIEDELQLGLLPEEMEVEATREGENVIRILVKTQRTIKKYTIEAVPPREYRHSPNASHEDCADYQAHARPITRSDLVGMGFDKDQVYALPAYVDDHQNRHESNDLDHTFREESTPALEQVLLCEEYGHIDVDGDGIAELVKSYRVENEILIDSETGEPAIETVDENPFAVASPFPRQHRIVGYSLADKTMDIQLARSETARQMFDGMAYANMPRPIVSEAGSSDETIDDILNPIPGSPIRVRSADAIGWASNTFDVGKSLSVMEWLSREGEGRTGMGRTSATLDENSLNPQTATEFAGRESQSEIRQEYMARNLVEAIRRAFGKLYRLMRVEAEPFRIKVDGKYRVIDPSTWPEDFLVKVNVGLGNGSKEKVVRGLMALSQPMMAAVEAGMATHGEVFKWFDKMARALDVGQGEDFVQNPDDPAVAQQKMQQEQQPDPAILEAQGKIELEREKAGANAALDRDKAQATIETDRMKAEMDMQVSREKAALEMELARDKAAAEIDLARERMAAELAMRQRMSEANVSQNRPGGSLAE